ncbi:M48 family metalloprotease [Streptomyces sp. NBC_01456]|uniref:M56 family metallopeptidase n=1 Tax=unclassified Streptomyces TaxID=2593676 RepID=UPI002E35AD4A|nr:MULTISPECIES: M56 family metallopeptidase [unclassified Streptomyces]
MRVSVYVPFAISALLALFAPWAATRLPPRPAAWALTCAALVAAGGWVGALALLAFTGVGQIPEVAEQGPWSITVLRAENPVHSVVAVICGLILAASILALGVAVRRHLRALLRARRECGRLPGGELAVIDIPEPEAYALPGAPGRIVVSRGMLRALDDAERQALLAHERAHLRHRHHTFQITWRLTAAVNPLLRPLATSGAFVLERWADEDAAAATGDRTVVARAVARAALATSGARRHPGALAAAGGPVPRRVRALFAPPRRPRRLPLIAGGLLLALCCGSLAEAAVDTDAMFAGAMYPRCTSAHQPGDRSADRLGVPVTGRNDCRARHRAEVREVRYPAEAGQQSGMPHPGQAGDRRGVRGLRGAGL